jgi:hypothetical protein
VPPSHVLGNGIRRERLLHDAQLVLDRPTPSPLAANPDLNLLRNIALKRPLNRSYSLHGCDSLAGVA